MRLRKMHSAVESSPGISLDEAADIVINAFVDSFLESAAVEYGTRRAIQRLIEETSEAALKMEEVADRTEDLSVRSHYFGVASKLKRLREQLEQILMLE